MRLRARTTFLSKLHSGLESYNPDQTHLVKKVAVSEWESGFDSFALRCKEWKTSHGRKSKKRLKYCWNIARHKGKINYRKIENAPLVKASWIVCSHTTSVCVHLNVKQTGQFPWIILLKWKNQLKRLGCLTVIWTISDNRYTSSLSWTFYFHIFLVRSNNWAIAATKRPMVPVFERRTFIIHIIGFHRESSVGEIKRRLREMLLQRKLLHISL